MPGTNRLPPDWWRVVTPGKVLKWGLVIFAYCLGILFIISVILAMTGYYG